MDFRSITREEHEDGRQVARDIAKARQYEISMKLRKKVEMLFAHLKRILGFGRLRLRAAHVAQTTNSSSPLPPRTSGNWPSSFLRRSNRENLREQAHAHLSRADFCNRERVFFHRTSE